VLRRDRGGAVVVLRRACGTQIGEPIGASGICKVDEREALVAPAPAIL